MNDIEQIIQETREQFKNVIRPSLFNSVFGLPTDEEIDNIIRSALNRAVDKPKSLVRKKRAVRTQKRHRR
jgi:hypothetical protein